MRRNRSFPAGTLVNHCFPAPPALSFDEQSFTFYITVIVCSYGFPLSPRFPSRLSLRSTPINLGWSYARTPETRYSPSLISPSLNQRRSRMPHNRLEGDG